MTISFPALEENGETKAWWLNNGAFWFTDGDFQLELMPSECNILAEEGAKHLGSEEPVQIWEAKDLIRPGLFVTTADYKAEIVGDELHVEETGGMSRMFGQNISKKHTVKFDRFLTLLRACYGEKESLQDGMISPLMGAVCLQGEKDTKCPV